MSARRPPTSFTVIGGFLGAGKTTLLNHWLRDARGERIAVLVNDFGALNIDAELIESVSGDTIALSNGCVCCQIGDDLSRALIEILESATPFDAIVVEASGVSDPWRIAQIGLADPDLSLGGVIVVADAAALPGHLADPLLADTMQRQLKAADLIVLNKTDVVDAAELAGVRACLATLAAGTPCFETVQSRVPPQLLRSPPLPTGAVATGGDAGAGDAPTTPETQGKDDPRPSHGLHESRGPQESHSSHGMHACGADCAHDSHARDGDPAHGELFQTWSARPSALFDAAALRRWIAAPPEGLLRLKALLRTGESEWSELQFAGRHASLRRTAAPGHGAAVVAIGLRGRLPRATLVALFGD